MTSRSALLHLVDDNLFGRLGGDPAKIGDVFHLFAQFVAKLDVRVKDQGIVKGYLGLFIFGLFDDVPELIDLDLAEFLVVADLDLAAASQLLACGRLNRLFNGLNQQPPVDAAIPADLIDYALQFR